MYLGYKYEKQLTILTSRITLLAKKEIHLSFFDKVKSDEFEGYGLQGFCFHNSTGISEEIFKDIIKDLNCIYWNKKDNHGVHEIMFIIASEDKIVNSWYKVMNKGKIATMMCRKYSIRDYNTKMDEITDYREKLEKEFKAHTV